MSNFKREGESDGIKNGMERSFEQLYEVHYLHLSRIVIRFAYIATGNSQQRCKDEWLLSLRRSEMDYLPINKSNWFRRANLRIYNIHKRQKQLLDILNLSRSGFS